MLLYDSPESGNCFKVRLLLSQLGIPYERRRIDTTQSTGREDVLGGKNPALRVPVLELDNGRHLAESNAILWYLGEGTPFVPTDRFDRAQVLQWMFFEQYDHEPYVAVVRHRTLHGRVDEFPDSDERRGRGEAALGVDGRASRRPGVPRRRRATRSRTSRSTRTRTSRTKVAST